MYCQNCGNELRQNLTFCNRCGGRLTTELDKFQNVNLKSANHAVARTLSVATGFVSVCGVVAVAVLINQMIFRGEISFAAFMLITVLSALIFGIVSLLINQISRASAASESADLAQKKMFEFSPDQSANQLPPRSQPAPSSVVEYTTRNLENVPREKY